MHIEFEKEYLRELLETGRTPDKKHRFQPEVIRGYIKCVRHLCAARCVEDLFPIRSLNYEMLKGDKVGISSVRINLQYRLEFTVSQRGNDEVIIVCNLIDISNHYK